MSSQGEDSPIMVTWSSTVSGSEVTQANGTTSSAGENRPMFVKRMPIMKITRLAVDWVRLSPFYDQRSIMIPLGSRNSIWTGVVLEFGLGLDNK